MIALQVGHSRVRWVLHPGTAKVYLKRSLIIGDSELEFLLGENFFLHLSTNSRRMKHCPSNDIYLLEFINKLIHLAVQWWVFLKWNLLANCQRLRVWKRWNDRKNNWREGCSGDCYVFNCHGTIFPGGDQRELTGGWNITGLIFYVMNMFLFLQLLFMVFL